jgi:hypothetical protein
MTFVFNQNITPASGADAIFQWKNFMKSTGAGGPGWTVVASGDGYGQYSNSGDVITNSTISAPPSHQYGYTYYVPGSLYNTQAWFVIQQPSSTRQFCFQSFGSYDIGHPLYDSSSASWRIKYSTTGFTVGGSASITPTASTTIDAYTYGAENAAVILGSGLGTDASPSGSTLFYTDGSYRMQMGADAAAPNAFYWFCSTITSTTISSGFLFDPMASGTAPGGDIDQYVIYYAPSTAFGLVSSLTTYGSCPSGFIKKNLPGETFTYIGAAVYSLQAPRNLQQTIGFMPSNPYSNADDLLPVVYMSAPFFLPTNSPISSAVLGYKGVSSTLKWCTTNRNNLDLLSVVNPGDRILIGNIALPWNNTSPII